jgi:DNA-binding PadR family transcriptional regulator
MAKGDFLGEFELFVMLALLRLGRDAYGMKVRREIEERTGRDASIGAVYATLERLEAKGLVASELAEPTPERGGRAKRTFQITGEGMAAVERSRRALEGMMHGLPAGARAAGRAR